MVGMTIAPVASPETAPKSVSILGATGSVGQSTLDLIARTPEKYSVEALTAKSSVDQLARDAIAVKAKLAVVADEDAYSPLKRALSGTGIEVAAGAQAVLDAAARPASWVMAGIVGTAGLKPILTAIDRGATIALANKEALVSAGDLVMGRVRECGATLLPVDSEHNAIFQVLDFSQLDKVKTITLTASGGPFRTWSLEQMKAVTPDQAVAHPNWSMGAKISVDSATMMNKGLELLEAHHLFPVGEDRLDILVHPQSVIHSMVSYIDGSVLAQLGAPDMRTPISYTLAWPERMEAPTPTLDLSAIGTLNFETPDEIRFPALRLAREVLQEGGFAPTVLNAANEVAVEGFLSGNLGFLDICPIVDKVLNHSGIRLACDTGKLSCLDSILEADFEARRVAREVVGSRL